MTSVYDLHSHSIASDGALTPSKLVQQAVKLGVKTLALTDHDTVAGLPEANVTAKQLDANLIPGIELSVTWNNRSLHIIGLMIDPTSRPLMEGTKKLGKLRRSRAETMGYHLAKRGIEGAYEGASRLAGKGMITRTHFARFLVNEGYASNVQDVFRRYLVRNKPGFVSTTWADLDEAINWIITSGGIAVVAHPMRYKLSRTKMECMLKDFKSAGGIGIEVVCGSSNHDDIHTTADYARRFKLFGSVGSDYHSPENRWINLGRLAPLPKDIDPVWSLWN